MNATVVPICGINSRSSGVARVSEEEFRSKLGGPAHLVWTKLCVTRNRDGEAHPTTDGLAKMKGFIRQSPRAVERALARLRAAGLVEDIGWVERTVPKGKRTIKRKVYVRMVYGIEQLDGAHRQGMLAPRVIVVPAETAEWLKQASSWGGARSGSGRKKMSNKHDANVSAEPSNHEANVVATPLTHGDNVSADADGAVNQEGGCIGIDPDRGHKTVAINQEGVPIYNYTSKEYSTLFSKEKRVRTRARAKPYFFSEETEESNIAAKLCDETNIGSIIGTGGHDAVRPLDTAGIPFRLGPEVLPFVKVPSPPRLDPASSAGIKVKALTSAYRAAIGHFFGVELDEAGPTVRFSLLAAAVKALVAHDIAPAAWAGFSCEVWLKHNSEPPALRWVFLPARITKHRGWFRQLEINYSGGRLLFGEKMRILISKHSAFCTNLIQGRDPHEVAARIFGEQSFDEMLAEARKEATKMQSILTRRARRGEWLW